MVEHSLKCPACIEGELQVLSDQIDIPHFGEVMISTLICSSCGYRSSDIVPLKSSLPTRYILKIDESNKMNIRVVRSGSSTVRIPEIGARIDPGLFSEGFVTNVEGILTRFQDILYQLLRDLESSKGSEDIKKQKESVNELIRFLGEFIQGKIPDNEMITLIVEDPLGNSAIIGIEENDVLTETLSEDEVAEILSTKKKKDVITDL